MAQNYTPLNPISRPPEMEPITVHEKVEHKPEAAVTPFIDVHHEIPQIPRETLVQTGAQVTAAPQFTTAQELKLPLTDTKIKEGLHKPITSSFRWLAELCTYLLKQANLRK